MAIPSTPRSVSDATRFTAQTPHASTKTSSRKIPASRRLAPSSSPPPSSSSVFSPSRRGGSKAVVETPEERIARLRAAHLAVKNSHLSAFDKVVDRVRPWMDSAHRFTVMTLVGFTGVAAVMTAYTAYDMLRYNRKRKQEFFNMAREAETDAMAAARLAYVGGEATPEQASMVEDMQARAQQQGVRLPPLFQSDGVTPRLLPPDQAMDDPSSVSSVSSSSSPISSKKLTWKDWALGNLRREEQGEDYGSSEARLGFESLNEEDDGSGARESDLVRAVEDKAAWAKEKARVAFQKERERQGKGGALDRIGLDQEQQENGKVNGDNISSAASEENKKGSWWSW